MGYPVIDPSATGTRINELRKDHGMSVAALRDYFGLATTNAVYKWLKGESMPMTCPSQALVLSMSRIHLKMTAAMSTMTPA